MADILLVTDVSWVENDVCSALSDGRHEISVISDPRRVVEEVSGTTPDIVVIDLQVGSMGGMAVARAIRDRTAVTGSPRPRLMLLLDRDADGFLAGRSGVDASLRKPFTADALRGALADLTEDVLPAR